ncbi:hypothetical protein BRD15_08340 [Halobacteriales archaeon SW_6_65_15]|jgi:hypothetical protein|nr:MAG: hypothetical protein BRD15_08340 [Halobacteriales archaeon SW_6_65_15]
MDDANALATKLDRITLLLAALLVVELFRLFGASILGIGFLAAFLLVGGLVVVFLLALAATF